MIIHFGTNNCPYDSSREILDKLLALKYQITRALPQCNVIFSKLIDRWYDNGIARFKVNNVNKHLESLELDLIDNSNITTDHLTPKGLHMEDIGIGKLAINFIKKIKKLNSSYYKEKN